jgi:hypothetical protein
MSTPDPTPRPLGPVDAMGQNPSLFPKPAPRSATPAPRPDGLKPLGPDDALGDGRALFKRPTSPWPTPYEQRHGITPQASDDWPYARPDAWGGMDAATAARVRQEQAEEAAARQARWNHWRAQLEPDNPRSKWVDLSLGAHKREALREQFKDVDEPPADWDG